MIETDRQLLRDKIAELLDTAEKCIDMAEQLQDVLDLDAE